MTPAGLPVWLNGRILNQAEARIDPADRGLLLGDGLFETMRVTDGAVRHFTLHMERLAHGAGVLMFPPPDTDMIAQAVRDLLAQAGFDGVHSRRDLAGIERISGGRLPGGAPGPSEGPASVPGV